LSAVISFACVPSPRQSDTHFPEFIFEIWGEAPSRDIRSLSEEKIVQKILFSIREAEFSSTEIASGIGEGEAAVLEKLNKLQQFGLVILDSGKWQSNIPLYTEKELREAEKLGMKFAAREAEILRKAIPRIRDTYRKTTVSSQFSWNSLSFIVVGGILSDLCVFDRIPFKREYFNTDFQPRLIKPNGERWGYTGFEKLPQRYPSRAHAFYHDLDQMEKGGIATWGIMDKGYKKASASVRPEFRIQRRHVYLALANGRLEFQKIAEKTGMPETKLRDVLQEMLDYNPPAIFIEDGRYRSGVPVFTEADLTMLLPELDKVAEIIHREVTIPRFDESKKRAQELGHRWPLPQDTYVRDKALCMLLDESLLTRIPAEDLDWNFGVWCWQGTLPLQADVNK